MARYEIMYIDLDRPYLIIVEAPNLISAAFKVGLSLNPKKSYTLISVVKKEEKEAM